MKRKLKVKIERTKRATKKIVRELGNGAGYALRN